MTFILKNMYESIVEKIKKDDMMYITYDEKYKKTEITAFEYEEAVYCRRTMIDTKSENTETTYYRIGEFEMDKTVNDIIEDKLVTYCKMPLALAMKYVKLPNIPYVLTT